jgi:phage-related protein
MKRTASVMGRFSIVLSLVILAGFFVETRSQTVQECKANLYTAKQLIGIQERQIANLNEQVQNRAAKAEVLQEKVDALNEIIGELRKQIDLQGQNNATLKDSVRLQQSIMDSKQQAITDRDALIKLGKEAAALDDQAAALKKKLNLKKAKTR